jgi:Domain of Unknown Function (DUF1206)
MPSSTDDVAPWIERMARVGYTAKGILYITIGYLAAEAAFGAGGKVTDTRGALREVRSASLGRLLVLVIAAGLVGYAAWRLVEAITDPERRGKDPKAVLLRLGYAGRGIFHAGLGITAVGLALGRESRSGGHASDWTARLFRLPAGELLVWIAAAWIAGYGIYQFYRAWSPHMRKHLRLAELPENLRSWVLGVSRFGIAARGVVFCLIGYFLAQAALRHDPGRAGGLRESLRTLAETGKWPFAVVAFGLISYGIFELVNARYRSIRVTGC